MIATPEMHTHPDLTLLHKRLKITIYLSEER